MAKLKKEEKNILSKFFRIDENVVLDEEEQEYLTDLNISIYELIEEEGEIGVTKIREIILDDLLKQNFDNLISYLGLEIEEDIETSLETKLNDPNFLKKEESEPNKDFFESYLADDMINDLVNSLLGFERKSEGSKEIFIKKRPAKIPTARIIAIGDILKSKFNKTEFLSEKEDTEQAQLIILAYSLVFDILLEIPNDICNTQKTIEILGMIVIKLSNAIGLSKGFRGELMLTMQSSYQSKLDKKNREGNMISD